MKLLYLMTMIGTMMACPSPLAGGATTEESGVIPAQWLQAQGPLAHVFSFDIGEF